MSRLLRALLYGLVPVALSLVLVSTNVQPAAALATIPVPVTGPDTFLGTATATGTAAGEIGASSVAGLAMAGLGAYDATCWALNNTGLPSLLHLPAGGSCPQVGTGFLGFKFGSNGDDRSGGGWWGTSCNAAGCTQRTGSGSAAVDGTTQMEIGSPAFSPSLGSRPGYYGAPVRYGVVCANGTTAEIDWGIFNSYNFAAPYEVNTIADTQANSACGGDVGYGVVLGHAVPASIKSYYLETGTCSGTNSPSCLGDRYSWEAPTETAESSITWARVYTYTYDPPKPWTMTWTETCTDGTTTSTKTATASWTPSPSGTAPNPNLAPCPSGQHVSDVSATGGRTGNGTELTVDQPTWASTTTTNYPLCTSKAPPGGCFLDLQKNGQSCFSGGVYCAGWIANETRWVMKCEWGPYELATSICEAQYGTTFDFETPPQPSQGPSTGAGGFPNPSTSPSTGPSTGTSTGALPTTGDNPTAAPTPYSPEPNADGTPGPNAESQSCWGSGWSWNPVSWVEVPVKCALAWAFVPTVSPTAISAPSLSGWSSLIPTSVPGGSCSGMSVTLKMPNLDGPDHPADAAVNMPDTCTGTLHGLAISSYAITALTSTVGLVMFIIGQVGKET